MDAERSSSLRTSPRHHLLASSTRILEAQSVQPESRCARAADHTDQPILRQSADGSRWAYWKLSVVHPDGVPQRNVREHHPRNTEDKSCEYGATHQVSWREEPARIQFHGSSTAGMSAFAPSEAAASFNLGLLPNDTYATTFLESDNDNESEKAQVHDPEPLITPEMEAIFRAFEKCLDLRDKYMLKSRQRLGDNPKDSLQSPPGTSRMSFSSSLV
ncbi:hypothetical protein HGRIS_001193 [Hohenbuehelia grisea]|uniref:Uncharacterized protein n=1 Tax=Hohenbuehelia grisea TaxID=104357 RepID=A0ABR3JPX3_9AGAR